MQTLKDTSVQVNDLQTVGHGAFFITIVSGLDRGLPRAKITTETKLMSFLYVLLF